MNGILLKDYEPLVVPLYDEEGRLEQGLVVGDLLAQNQALILQLHQGELKEFPAVGCGLSDSILQEDLLALRSLIREQLEMDGQRVRSIRVSSTSIEIDASY